MADITEEARRRLIQAQRKAVAALEDPCALLVEPFEHPRWQRRVGRKNVFHVLGMDWFRDEVLCDHARITKCDHHVSLMENELRRRDGWRQLDQLKWDDVYALRQIVDVMSSARSKIPRFDKAAKTILLCEMIARDLYDRHPSSSPHPNLVYFYMALEPAVTVLHGFTTDVFRDLVPEQKMLLRQYTGQVDNDVFVDMTNGRTVTRKLAERVALFFKLNAPNVALGNVDSASSRIKRFVASPNELVEVELAKLPEAVQMAEAPQA